MFKGLEHTAIASPDPERLALWYVNHLEFHINFTYQGWQDSDFRIILHWK